MVEQVLDEKKSDNPLISKNNLREYNLEIEEPGAGVERFYFWVLKFLESTPPSGLSFNKIEKLRDAFSTSETSSYFGAVEQRKGAQQDKVSQFLATIGKMLKDTFQIIRELRIIEERLEYYDKSEEGDEPSEIALKSIWIDLVEGGAKNPTSVLGLATQVGFTILPDLFFHVHPKDQESVKSEVAKLSEQGINKKIQEVLLRKLTQYVVWKIKTEKEIRQREKFVLSYLRQHYDTIKLYMNWVRPYLRNIKKMQIKETERPEMITAFETSLIDIEILALKEDEKKWRSYHPCVYIQFSYVAIPQMAYQQELQRGAIHTGKTNIKMQAYSLTDEQIEEYKKKEEDEDFELLGSLNEAMDTLKDDLQRFLEKAGGKYRTEKKDQETKKEPGIVPSLFKGFTQPIKEVSKGFKEIKDGFKGIFQITKSDEKSKTSWSARQEKKKAGDKAKSDIYILYDVFKKAHGMVTW